MFLASLITFCVISMTLGTSGLWIAAGGDMAIQPGPPRATWYIIIVTLALWSRCRRTAV